MLPYNSEFGSPSIFGISHNPGNNQNSSTGRSIFGGTSSGVFGASSSSTSSTTFGSPMPAFTGSSTFGLGSSIFWQKPIFDTSSSGFGFTSSSPSFGQPTMSAFSSSFPGTIQSPFQPQTSLSGCQVSIPTGWSTGFQQPISAENHGSRVAPYRETVVGGEIPLSISAMPFYSDKSHEELRWEDKGSSILGTQKPTFGTSSSGFGFTSSPSLGQPTMSAFSGSFFQEPAGYQVWSPGFGFGPGKELASRVVNVPCRCQTAVDSEKPLSVSAMPLSHEELRWEHYKGGSRIGTAIPKPFYPLTPSRTPAFAFQNLSPFSTLFVQSTNSSIIQPKPANMFLSATSASSENLFWTTPSSSCSHSSTSSSPSICCSNFITSTTSPAVVLSSPTESGTKNTNNTSSLFPSTSSATCLPPLPQPSPLFTSLPPFTTLQPSTTAPFLPCKPNLMIPSPFTGSTFEKSSCIPSQISTNSLTTTTLSPPFQPAQTAQTSGKNSTEACEPVSNVAINEEKEGEKFTGEACTIDDATSPYNKHSAVDVKELMPKLHKSPEYYTEPEIQDLESMERVEPGSITRVKDFVIGRHGYGSIKFLGPTGVCQLDLESLIQFNDREVIVYADENKKHAIGQGINKAAEVTLLNIKCFDKRTGKQCVDGRNVVKYREMLIKTAADRGAEFVSYDPVKGEWKFKVHHFI